MAEIYCQACGMLLMEETVHSCQGNSASCAPVLRTTGSNAKIKEIQTNIFGPDCAKAEAEIKRLTERLRLAEKCVEAAREMEKFDSGEFEAGDLARFAFRDALARLDAPKVAP